MEQKIITVGIPTYNRPDKIKSVLQCLKEQTFKNIQILVSDNGSNIEHGIQSIVENAKSDDDRISYFRQPDNIGLIRNLLFLLDKAQSEYFIWIADDDIFDKTFLEEMYCALEKNKDAVVSITGVDISDVTDKDTVKFEITDYLAKLSGDDIYSRLKEHITQPPQWGKARVLWGLCRTKALKLAVEKVISQGGFSNGSNEIWSMQFPLDMQLLVEGDLIVVEKNLFHVYLMPTSNGLREGNIFRGKEIELCKITYEAYRKVVYGTSLTENEKKELIVLLNKEETKDLIKIVPFYMIKRYAPWLARWLKKIYFSLFVKS